MSKIIGLNKLFLDKHIRVFITCNVNDERRFQDHVKDIEVFKIYYPSFKDSYVYVMNAFDKHNINDYDTECLLNVASKCKGNIREIVLNLNTSETELECRQQEKTFKDMNNFEVAKYILQKKATFNDIEVLCKSDVGVIPHLLYENLPDECETNYKTLRGNSTWFIDMYLDINKCFIDASRFEENAFTSHDWNMLGHANYLKLHSIHDKITCIDRKQSVKDVKYRFSLVVSKISHKNIMNKKMKTISMASNVSNSSVIMATDMHASNTIKLTKKKEVKQSSKDKVFAFDEGSSIVSTYQKYFSQ